MSDASAHSLDTTSAAMPGLLPPGAVGIDAGMTMVKVVSERGGVVHMAAYETARATGIDVAAVSGERTGVTGVTGVRAGAISRADSRTDAVQVQEIDAAARGCVALMEAGGSHVGGAFLVALLGTGTAFAVATADDGARHLGGTALGGGSFLALAKRIAPGLTYDELVAAAERGDRRRADVMVADVYPEGIGRIGPDLTAAHLAKEGGDTADVLAALLNLHGESIGQIAAGRARMAGVDRIILCGGFVHHNTRLVESIAHMAGLFGHTVECIAHPGYAGAIGAARIAAEGRSA